MICRLRSYSRQKGPEVSPRTHRSTLNRIPYEAQSPRHPKEYDYPDSWVIVSTTDPKGIITYCNKAFIDVSGFSEQELLGANHNIIRHPDMPPAAFKDLWDTIKKGKPWRGSSKIGAKTATIIGSMPM